MGILVKSDSLSTKLFYELQNTQKPAMLWLNSFLLQILLTSNGANNKPVNSVSRLRITVTLNFYNKGLIPGRFVLHFQIIGGHLALKTFSISIIFTKVILINTLNNTSLKRSFYFRRPVRGSQRGSFLQLWSSSSPFWYRSLFLLFLPLNFAPVINIHWDIQEQLYL